MFLILTDHFFAVKSENDIVTKWVNPDKYHESEVTIMPKFASGIKTINTKILTYGSSNEISN